MFLVLFVQQYNDSMADVSVVQYRRFPESISGCNLNYLIMHCYYYYY